MNDLISRLRDAAEQIKKGVVSPAHVAVIQEAVTALEKMRWIPVEEALPDKYQEVLTTIIGTDFIDQEEDETFEEALERSMHSPVRVSFSFRDDDGLWTDATMGFPEIIAPSFWMPLPEPPMEDLK